MLRPRIIPCLLVRNEGLVKTFNFGDHKYVGDPINAVKIFNEKESDELMVLDIDATVQGRGPDFKMISHLARECRMPLCYGGGVKTVDQARRIIGLGVEKVSMGSASIEDPSLLERLSGEVGSQSVVAVLDVKKKGRNKYEVYLKNGKVPTGKDPFQSATALERLGIGEIVINSIDNDGMMKGYDLDLARRMRDAVSIPMTILGGAGSLDDIGKLIAEFGIVGAAAGSLFVFKGIYKAVLINYPDEKEKEGLIGKYFPK